MGIPGAFDLKADDPATGIRAKGHEAIGIQLDAQSIGGIHRSVDQLVRDCGSLDILVNCVDIRRGTSPESNGRSV